MNQKIKKNVFLSMILIISIVLSRCQKDDDLEYLNDQGIAGAKVWFDEYESKGENVELSRDLNYDWTAAEVKKSPAGAEIIVVPVIGQQNEIEEIWEQKLYIYKVSKNTYKALLYEIYPDVKNMTTDNFSIDSGSFSGYITAWDLKNGFVKAAKFENGEIVESGYAEITNQDKLDGGNATAKVPFESDDYEYCNCQTQDGPHIKLREVIVQNDYQNNTVYYTPRNIDKMQGGTIDYTSNYGGPHGGAAGGNAASTGANVPVIVTPCDKVKEFADSPVLKAKMEILKRQTGWKKESGFAQKNDGTFITLTSSTSDVIDIPKNITGIIGFMHTHLDSYERLDKDGELGTFEPIRMFSPVDVKQFLIIVHEAQKSNIPINSIYGTMVSSTGTYQLKFTGNVADISAKYGSIKWKKLDGIYQRMIENNGLEKGFLKFLYNKIGIEGIELYKIEATGNSRKTLDSNGKVVPINCN